MTSHIKAGRIYCLVEFGGGCGKSGWKGLPVWRKIRWDSNLTLNIVLYMLYTVTLHSRQKKYWSEKSKNIKSIEGNTEGQHAQSAIQNQL